VIQAAPLSRALAARVREVLVNTGQHYDWAMDQGQLQDVALRQPEYNLQVGSRPDEEQLTVAATRIAKVIDDERPDVVLVRGDTNSTLAGARAATACGVPVVHVEAGLRSHRTDMPEERNRVETDALARILCAPTEAAQANLRREGVPGETFLTGDVLYDLLLRVRGTLRPSGEARPYALATIHRNYNTDSDERLADALACLGVVPYRVIFPIHPRTRRRLDEGSFDIPANVEVREPVTYLRMLELEREAEVVLTDSGGVQREAYMLGRRCITLRDETEWVETVEAGWNVVTGLNPAAVTAALRAGLPDTRPPIFGDGRASERITQLVADYVEHVS
jgi:UDP-N-acetylglucosamine 2-epimerase